MTKIQQTAMAAGAFALGGVLLTRGLRLSRRMDFRGRSVVITGGSRGLGLLVARELAGKGARLTLAARDRAELERARDDLVARGADASIAVCDIVTTVCPGLMRTGSPFNAWFKGRHRDEFTWFVISDSLPLVSIDARRAAAQLIDACRHGDPELVITWPAKFAIVANAVFPEIIALAMDAVNRALLPAPAPDAGHEMHSGWQSLSDWAPSRFTRLSDRAAAEYNELPH